MMKLIRFCCIFIYIVVTGCNAVTPDEHVIAELHSYFKREFQLAMQQQESRIEELEQTVRRLILTQQNKPTGQLQLRMEIKNMRKAMSEEIQELRHKLDEKTSEVNALKEQVEMLEQKHMAKEAELVSGENFEKRNEITEDMFVKTQLETAEIQTHKGLRRQVNTQGGPAVAFFARLTSDSPQLSPNQDIVFNDVMINVGGGYHNVHGAFIAPVPGIYVFTTSMLSHKSGPSYAAHAKLVKNGTLLAILDASEPDGIAQASQTVIVQLAKGDGVAVQNEHYSGTIYYGSNYSTFSGFLLYDLSEPAAIVG